jgi:hypothetical protein
MTTDQESGGGADGMSAHDLVLQLLTGYSHLTPKDAQRLLTDLRADWTGHGTPARAVREGEADVARLPVSRDDLTELAAILTAKRNRLDKGDGSPVPQPRWAANVRISQAVFTALGGLHVGGGELTARDRLFGFVEAGAEESDLPTFAAALDTYRAEVLRGAADWFDRYDTDSAAQLRRMASGDPS